MRELERLLALLQLENAHNEGTIEWERFALLDPADPHAEEVCLLADQLSAAVGAYRSARRLSSATGRRAAA